MTGASSTKAFICYSHRDKKCVDRLLVHLKPLGASHQFDVWSDKRIQTGARWRDEIQRSLEECKVAIVVVSADFFASPFIQEVELPTLLRRAKDGVRILPLIASPCDFEATALAEFQAFNKPEEAWAEMVDYRRERLLAGLVQQIRESLEGSA